jgi:hypothetical protein
MRRLLTGYAMAFNRRHRRHGQLFQNRYKSILCQEDAYLLEKSNEQYERRYRIAAKGVDLKTLVGHVAKIFDLAPEQLLAPGRYPTRVKARSLLFFWAVRELGMTATELAKATGMTQPAVSISVKRGEQIAMENNLDIEELL